MLHEIEVKRPAGKSAGYTFTAFMCEYLKIYIYIVKSLVTYFDQTSWFYL